MRTFNEDCSYLPSFKETCSNSNRESDVSGLPNNVLYCWTVAEVRHPKHAGSLLNITQRSVQLSFSSSRTHHLIAGGVVLWSRSFTPEASHLASSPSSPVNSLIREALIEGRAAEEKYEKDGYAVKWTFFNDLELIFVVC